LLQQKKSTPKKCGDKKAVLSMGEVLERTRKPEGKPGGGRMRSDSAEGD